MSIKPVEVDKSVTGFLQSALQGLGDPKPNLPDGMTYRDKDGARTITGLHELEPLFYLTKDNAVYGNTRFSFIGNEQGVRAALNEVGIAEGEYTFGKEDRWTFVEWPHTKNRTILRTLNDLNTSVQPKAI